MTFAKIWTGEYRGIRYRITQELDHDEGEWWWGEVILVKAQLGRQDRKFFFPPGEIQMISGKEHVFWHPPKLQGLPRSFDTFHVECAYGAPQFLVAYLGWDYQHLWDEHRSYDQEIVRGDCIACINRLHQLFRILSLCPYCGRYGDADAEQWVNPGFGMWTPIHPECNQKRIADALANPLDGFCPYHGSFDPQDEQGNCPTCLAKGADFSAGAGD